MLVQKKGFLFDVDGTLTTFGRQDSIIDLLIINDLELIRQKGYPIGLITGRSVEWVKNFFFKHVNETLKDFIQIFGEYGLINWINGKKRKATIPIETKKILSKVKKEIIKAICDYKELIPILSYTNPDERSLWIEPKEVMITFRALPIYGLTSDKYLKIIEPIIQNYSNILKIVQSPLAIDILPIEASKKTAAEKAIKVLDLEKKVNKWYAFGDSDADSEMALAENSVVKFYKIKSGVTSELHYYIEKILCDKI